MKNRLLKCIALAIVSIMIIAQIVGCTSSASTQSSASAAVDTASAAASATVAPSATDLPVATAKAPVTLTLMSVSFSWKNTGVQTDPVATLFGKATGISINVINNIPSQDDYKAKMTAMAASGDLPDIITLNASDAANVKIRDQLINAGAIVELTDLLKSNGQNLLANPKINAGLEYRRKFYSPDGKSLYVIPCIMGAQSRYGDPVVAVYTVWDFYKELGYPKVDTSDDLLTVFTQMQKLHPTGLDGKKAYGVSFHVDWGMEPIWENMMFDGYYPHQMLSIDISNSNVTEMFTDKQGQFWKWMNWYYKANQLGILDPDSFTMKFDQLTAKMDARDTYFYTLAGGSTPVRENYSALDYAPGKNMDANYGVAGGSDLYAITSNCKTPDRAMDLFNWFASDDGMMAAYNGVKGSSWDAVSGVPQLTQAYIDETKKTGTDNHAYELFGANIWNRFAPLSGNEMNTTLNSPYSLGSSAAEIKKNMGKADTAMAAYYGTETVGQVFLKRQYNGYLNPIGAAMPMPTDALKENLDKINAYMAANWLKPIAAKDDADYAAQQDKIIADINAMGYQDVAAWYIKTWNTIKAEVEATGMK